MANVSRVTAIWTGFSGAPGYSKFSFMPLADDTARNAAGAAVRQFFSAITTILPNGTSIAVQAQIDDLDLVSGQLMSSANMTTVPTTMTSVSSAAAYAGGSGLCVTWSAVGVFAGRRIKGRTFIVPTVASFENDGSLQSSVITLVQTAGNALIATAGADLAIWNREWTKAVPPVPIQGSLTSATSCTVKDTASQLRSRRT